MADILGAKKPEVTYKIDYQWQYRQDGSSKWANDGEPNPSLKKALNYLNVASECGDCTGHRLIQTVTISGSRIIAKKVRLLYTIKSKPKENVNADDSRGV